MSNVKVCCLALMVPCLFLSGVAHADSEDPYFDQKLGPGGSIIVGAR